MYKFNDFGEIINAIDTYAQAAMDLFTRGHVVLNWTDGQGTLLNILLSFDPTRLGCPGGIVDEGPGKLWVGVAGKGCFGFGCGGGYCAPDYVAEKLGVKGYTAVQLAQLITEVRELLADEVYDSNGNSFFNLARRRREMGHVPATD